MSDAIAPRDRDPIDDLLDRALARSNNRRRRVGRYVLAAEIALLIAGAFVPGIKGILAGFLLVGFVLIVVLSSGSSHRPQTFRTWLRDEPERIDHIAYRRGHVTLVERSGLQLTLPVDPTEVSSVVEALSARCPKARVVEGTRRGAAIDGVPEARALPPKSK